MLLLILFFSFFNVSFALGGSLSPDAVASEFNTCTGIQSDMSALAASAVQVDNRVSSVVDAAKSTGAKAKQSAATEWNRAVNAVF